jgi:hypothetical protein
MSTEGRGEKNNPNTATTLLKAKPFDQLKHSPTEEERFWICLRANATQVTHGI